MPGIIQNPQSDLIFVAFLLIRLLPSILNLLTFALGGHANPGSGGRPNHTEDKYNSWGADTRSNGLQCRSVNSLSSPIELIYNTVASFYYRITVLV